MRYPIPSLGIILSNLLAAVSLHAAQIPATITLGNLSQTYNASPLTPSVVTNPAGLPVQVTYRNLAPGAPAPVSQVVYNDSPDPLALSYLSYPFSASQITALGNYVQIAGSARKLESCDVILVSWALASEWPVLAAANPAGFLHPITISIYEVSSTNQLIPKAEVTQDVLIPWRPLTLPNGNEYPYRGTAFRANIPFTNGVILPEKVLVMVSFNTQNSGFSPIGVSGPYNSLNVAQKSTTNVVPVGSDVNADVILQVKYGQWSLPSSTEFTSKWFYPSTGFTTSSVPMIRLNALSTESITPPVNAGTWQATASIANADYSGSNIKNLVIQKATAAIELGNLTPTYTGSPLNATTTTTPSGVAVSLSYNGSSTAPINAGTYPVTATVTDPNYVGGTSGSFRIAKAPATVALSNLVQVSDGNPKSVSVTTSPTGLATTTTYGGLSSAPSAIGKYVVQSAIFDANYEGTATGELWLGQNLQSWMAPWVQNETIPAAATGPNDDPDNDSIPNLLEYAFGLNPAVASPSSAIPKGEYSAGQLSLVFQRNLAATDLQFEVESTDTLGGSDAWNPSAASETVLSTDGTVQSVRASLPIVSNEKKRFARLKVVQTTP